MDQVSKEKYMQHKKTFTNSRADIHNYNFTMSSSVLPLLSLDPNLEKYFSFWSRSRSFTMRRAVSVARFLKMLKKHDRKDYKYTFLFTYRKPSSGQTDRHTYSWRVSGRPSPGGGGGGGATGGATIGTSGTSVIRAGSDI